MSSRRNFLSILVLILAGSVAIPTDYVFAKKAVKSKKKADKKKKSDKKEKTASVVESNADEVRASSTSTERRGSSNSTSTTSTTTTTTSTVTDPDVLESNLKACLAGPCTGSGAGAVSYDQCFKTSNLESKILQNCSHIINGVASDVVAMAREKLEKSIRNQLVKQCAAAEGKVVNDKCKIKIWYYAKAPNGTSVSRSREESIGSTFTCTYSTFGLSQQDLEYKGEKSAEQKIAEMQAAIQIGTAVLNTTMSAVQAVNASKNLKRASAYVEDAWYYFNGTTLEPKDAKDITCRYYYGANGSGLTKKELENITSIPNDNRCSVDNNGAKYCTYTDADRKKLSVCPGKGAGYTECDKNNISSKNCYVYIEKSNELKKAEKLKELISWMDLNKMKSAALHEQQKNTFIQGVMGAKLSNSLSTKAGSIGDLTCPNTVYFTKNNTYSGIEVKDIKSATDAYKKEVSSSAGNPQCTISGQGFVCTDASAQGDKWKGCRWDNATNTYIMNFTDTNEELKYVENQYTSFSNEYDKTMDTFQSLSKSDATDIYNNTVTAYNNANNNFNTKKKEIEALEAQSSSALSNVVSQGTQVLLTGVTTGLTNKIAADSNKEVMTGACYRGTKDPKSDLASVSLIAQEGATIKLTWD